MPESDNSTFSIGARMRAARHLAGIKSVPALAETMGLQGLAQTRLYQIERDEIPAEYRDLAEIAYACKVPVAWFTADFNRLPELSADPRDIIQSRLAEARPARARRGTRPEGE